MSSVHGARLARARRALISELKRANAFSNESAVPLEPTSSLERTEFEHMLKREVIRRGMRGGYWLDRERYADWQRQNLLFVVGVLLVTAGFTACMVIYMPSHPRHHRHHHGAAADSVATPRSSDGE
jgi:hypothetical protein